MRRKLWRNLIDFLWFGLTPAKEDYEDLTVEQLSQLARQGWLVKGMVARFADAQQPLRAEPPKPESIGYSHEEFAREALRFSA